MDRTLCCRTSCQRRQLSVFRKRPKTSLLSFLTPEVPAQWLHYFGHCNRHLHRGNTANLTRIFADTHGAAETVGDVAAASAVLVRTVDVGTVGCYRRRSRSSVMPRCLCRWRGRSGGHLSTSGLRSVWPVCGAQHADALAYRLRQEAVLVSETSAEMERLAGARRAVVEPRRLVVRFTVESEVGIQLTVLERQIWRRCCRLRICWRIRKWTFADITCRKKTRTNVLTKYTPDSRWLLQ